MSNQLRQALEAMTTELDRRGMTATVELLTRRLTAEGSEDEARLEATVKLGLNELKRHGLQAFAQALEVDLGWREAVDDDAVDALEREPEPQPEEGGEAKTVDLEEGVDVSDQVEVTKPTEGEEAEGQEDGPADDDQADKPAE